MSIKLQNREIVVFSSPHRVYASIMKIFESISKIGKFSLVSFSYDSTNSISIIKSSTNHIQYTKQDFNKKNIYLFQSPLVFLGMWEALIQNVPLVGISEYIGAGGYKDAVVRVLMSNFKSIPFIAHTKRAKEFLETCGFKAVFLVPPAENKRQGGKERKHILFVGKLIESKNIFLLLKIAKHFKGEKFIIIGNGPLLDKVNREANSIHNVRIVPSVESREELFRLYSQAKMLIHPAFKDPVGFVVIEALSTQTPALVSSGAGASDYLPPDWVADPKDEKEWILKAGRILKDQNESVREAERIFAEEHLDIADPFFEKSADLIYQSICSRWPHLCEAKKD